MVCVLGYLLIVWCSTLHKAGIQFNCCGSCHDESDNGYSYLCGMTNAPDDIDTEERVCCAAAFLELTDEQWNAVREAAKNENTND